MNRHRLQVFSRPFVAALAVAALTACAPMAGGAPALVPALARQGEPSSTSARPAGTLRLVGRLAVPTRQLLATVEGYTLADVGRLRVRLLASDASVIHAVDIQAPITDTTPIALDGLKAGTSYTVEVSAYAADGTTLINLPAQSTTPIDTRFDQSGMVYDEITANFKLTFAARPVSFTAQVPINATAYSFDEMEVELFDANGVLVIPAERTPYIWGGGILTIDLKDLRPSKAYRVRVTGYSSATLVAQGEATFTTPAFVAPVEDTVTLPELQMGGTI